MKHIALVLLVIFSSSAAVSQAPDSLRQDGVYAGVRVGLPFLFGLRVRYIGVTDHDGQQRPLFYADADAATSILINTVNLGGGWFPFDDIWYVGAKYHFLTTPLTDDPTAWKALISGEVGARIPIDRGCNWLFTIDAGPIYNPGGESVKVLFNTTLGVVGRLY